MISKPLTTFTQAIDGWLLEKDGKYWGEIYPADGKRSAIMGWTDDLRMVQMARCKDCPATKTHFGGGAYADQMEQGRWIHGSVRYVMVFNPTDEG